MTEFWKGMEFFYCTYIHIPTCLHTYIHKNMWTCAFLFTYIHILMHICLHTYTLIYSCTSAYINTHVYIHSYIMPSA